ncbi:MAG TPA: exodeoxyribonuclease III [Gaiellales bacterium]|nr:exodeoxyribonuclease III [Gaiellales bacterium]
MRIVTWNVNSLKVRLPRVLELLDELAPDVLCLQETKVESAAFPHDELREAGYAAVDHSGGRWAGVAVLAPLETTPVEVGRGLPGEPDPEDARWIEAEVVGIRFVSTYVPNGREPATPWFEQKLHFLEAARARIAELAPAGSLVLAGDFNIAPADIDVYDPAAFAGSTHVTPEERAAHHALLDAGLLDAYRVVSPEGQRFTWWDYRAGHFHKNLGMRIDHVLLTPDLAARLTACDIARDFRKGSKPSDHAPLVADLS